uniref:Uncharacterized protein n=1 Tax=Acrobeloides nanus TaxID=290746 RepID=A0A914EM27_9BILA
MQITITQPSDAGRYFCVVRNSYTNQTRKAPRPIVLMVEPTRVADGSDLPRPQFIYPEDVNNLSEPIPLHVVAGQTAILECVIWGAKPVWNKADYSLQQISLTDDRARIRQIAGNLRIKSVSISDAGEYVCHAVTPSPLDSSYDLLRNDHPKVRYQLIVHAPTNVRLMLAQQVHDKSWQLSCYAHNLRYEIPMVYANGLALIDAMKEMGVPPQTNFYTNPINVTLQANNPLSGSIQCISRPAMEEAEVYGVGLERGRAMNLYVDARLNIKHDLILQGPANATKTVGDRVQMTCKTVSPTVKVRWTKDAKLLNLMHNRRLRLFGNGTLEISDLQLEDQGMYTCEANKTTGLETSSESAMLIVENRKSINNERAIHEESTHFLMNRLTIKKPSAFVTGHNVRVQWNFFPSNHPDVGRLSKQKIEFRHANQTSWALAEQVQGHVRAETIHRLSPGLRYIFRVVGFLDDGSVIESETTDWLSILPSPHMIPSEPHIVRLQTVSHNSMLVAWNHSALVSNGDAEKFIVSYGPTRRNVEPKSVEVSSSSMEMLLTDLEPSTEYRVTVTAENDAGRSHPSRDRKSKTFGLSPIIEQEDGFWARLKKNFGDFSPAMSIKFVVMMFSASIAVCLLILLCCLTCCQLNDWHERRRTRKKAYKEHGAHNIYSDQGYKNGKIYKQRPMFNSDPIDELSPLNYHEQYDEKKENINKDGNSSERLRLESKPAPNLYGNINESMHSFNGSRMSLERGPRSDYTNTNMNGFMNDATYADLNMGLYRMNGLPVAGSMATMRGCSALSSHELLPQTTRSPFRSISSATGAAYSSYLPKLRNGERGILSYSPDEYSSTLLDSNSSAPLLANGSNSTTRNQLSQSPDSLINGQNQDLGLPKSFHEGKQQLLSTFKSSDSPTLSHLAYGTLDRRRLYGSTRGSTADMMRSITRLSDD